MAEKIEVDVEALGEMSPDARAVLGDAISGMEAASAVGMSRFPDDFDKWRGLGEWAGAASAAMEIEGIGRSVVEGDYGEAAANGLSDVLQRSTQMPQVSGAFPSGSAHAAWADAVAGTMVDSGVQCRRGYPGGDRASKDSRREAQRHGRGSEGNARGKRRRFRDGCGVRRT